MSKNPELGTVSSPLSIGTGGPKVSSGFGTPELAVTGDVGDLFIDIAGGISSTLYVKESLSGTPIGWSAVGSGGGGGGPHSGPFLLCR